MGKVKKNLQAGLALGWQMVNCEFWRRKARRLPNLRIQHSQLKVRNRGNLGFSPKPYQLLPYSAAFHLAIVADGVSRGIKEVCSWAGNRTRSTGGPLEGRRGKVSGARVIMDARPRAAEQGTLRL